MDSKEGLGYKLESNLTSINIWQFILFLYNHNILKLKNPKDSSMYQTRMKEAIEAIKKGEMIIIMDDEDREEIRKLAIW